MPSLLRMKVLLNAFVLLAGLILDLSPARADTLKALAHIGPWPVASQLIGYQNRLWFATSVKGVNHNSSDLWSLDMATGATRYERYLFSQDAGIPTVHQDLLYWPYEDMRDGSGWGAASVTDGTRWSRFHVPTLRAFHLHSLRPWKGTLVGTTAAYTAGLHVSADNGSTWQMLTEFKPRVGRFVRLTEIGVENDNLFAVASERTGPTLMQYADGKMEDVPGWPKGQDVFALTTHRDALFSIVGRQGSTVWRIRNGRPAALGQGEEGWWLRALTSDGKRLWAVQAKQGGGAVWSSADGDHWQKEHDFTGGRAWSIARVDGKTFVGGAGAGGKAIIWGPDGPVASAAFSNPKSVLPRSSPTPGKAPITDWQQANRNMIAAFAAEDNYAGHATPLARLTYTQALNSPPDRYFRSLLDFPKPDRQVDAFGGQFTISTAELANWKMLWGMGLAGEKQVAPEILKRPWIRTSNGPEKWFDQLLIGLWAIQWSGQNDQATMDALINRLGYDRDPVFITSQVVGTLNAVTGQRYAYDRQAWQAWWETNRDTWPK
ncbi:hypothetical protein [Anderseniella sp. Alg231-50]|uniref:hypothetical protein n=1 Tax=Anderseniella sp. Alg231-50 TaxID=1922226 RepID=UPI00307BE1E3